MSAGLGGVLADFKKDQQRKEAAKATAEKKAVKDGIAKGKRAGKGQEPAKPAVRQSTRDFLTTGRAPMRGSTPLGKQIKDIVDHLESTRKLMTPAALREVVLHDIQASPELREALARNPKIALDAQGAYRYKPEHDLQDASELLNFIRKQPRGCPTQQLLDSYKGVEDDLKVLQSEGKIWVLPNPELGSVAFQRDQQAELTTSQDLQEFWHSIKIPEDPALVVTELEKAKLQPIPRSVARKRVAPPPKEKSRKRQRIRLDTATNVHMPELIQGTGPDLQSID